MPPHKKLDHGSLVWLGMMQCGLNAAMQKDKQWFGDILLQTLSYLRTDAIFCNDCFFWLLSAACHHCVLTFAVCILQPVCLLMSYTSKPK